MRAAICFFFTFFLLNAFALGGVIFLAFYSWAFTGKALWLVHVEEGGKGEFLPCAVWLVLTLVVFAIWGVLESVKREER